MRNGRRIWKSSWKGIIADLAHKAWKQTNAQARWTIYFNCEEAIQKSINKKVNASEVWTYLKDQFGSQADIAWWSTARSLMNHTLAGSKDYRFREQDSQRLDCLRFSRR
jgi:hypothetical protein